ncbi:hypothetical protein [Micromonospora chalcea]|uniref:hypothetical protein n=1 Tax=Micromonospora chalcea TaxID=1874 RepID=UPI003D75671B
MSTVLVERHAAPLYGRALTHDELREHVNDEGRVVVLVGVAVPDIVHYAERGQWNSMVAEWVTGDPAGLVNVECRAAGVELTGLRNPDDDAVLVEVSGEVVWPVLTRGESEG